MTEEDKFRPTQKQLNFVHVYTATDLKTITDICKVAGIVRQTYYDWRKSPDFCEWFSNQIAIGMKGQLPGVWRSIKSMSERKTDAARLFLQRFDDDYSEKSEVKHKIEFDEEYSKELKKMTDKVFDDDVKEEGEEGKEEEKDEEE